MSGVGNVKNVSIETVSFLNYFKYIWFLNTFDLNEQMEHKGDENITELGVFKKLE